MAVAAGVKAQEQKTATRSLSSPVERTARSMARATCNGEESKPLAIVLERWALVNPYDGDERHPYRSKPESLSRPRTNMRSARRSTATRSFFVADPRTAWTTGSSGFMRKGRRPS